MIKAQVCIVGAGAGGIGCAYRLIKHGIKTVVVDKNPDFGGTMVFSGVDGWEPGVSLDGLHRLLYEAMAKEQNGCHIVTQVPNGNLFSSAWEDQWDGNYSFAKYPWALALGSAYRYEDTFKRVPYRFSKRLQFEPGALSRAVNAIFASYSEHLVALFGYQYVSCHIGDGKIAGITVSNGDTEEKIFADYFVDATGDIILARDAGCETAFGCEGHEDYGEPSANERSNRVNGVSFVFRIAKTNDEDHVDKIPSQYRSDASKYNAFRFKDTVSFIVEYPNGDFNVNMLPTMQGDEYFALGENADTVGRAMIWAYWHYLQTEKSMNGFTLKHIYDVGIRESHRLKGKYVLREQDLRAGMLSQPKKGRTVAIADHALDIHGTNGMCKELMMPYEIPIECTMTNEFSNLFVACRGASFTHIAASSVRLSRTMMSLGEGVGEYLAEQL